MSPQFPNFPVIGNSGGVTWQSGGYSNSQGAYDNVHDYRRSVDSYYVGEMDDATRNWGIAYGVTGALRNFIGGQDPEAQRFLGLAEGITGTVFGVRNMGRERSEYHERVHDYQRNSGVYNNNSGHYNNGGVYHQQYGFVDPNIYGPGPTDILGQVFGNSGGVYYPGGNSGYESSEGYHRESHSSSGSNGWNQWGQHSESGGGYQHERGWDNYGWPFGNQQYENNSEWGYRNEGGYNTSPPIYTPGWNTWPPIVCW